MTTVVLVVFAMPIGMATTRVAVPGVATIIATIRATIIIIVVIALVAHVVTQRATGTATCCGADPVSYTHLTLPTKA